MYLEWNLHYEGWIIEDGGPERAIKQDFDWFCLEFYSKNGLEKTQESGKSAVAVPNYKYRVVAELVFLSEKSCVIDFGLSAIGYADNIPPECKEGEYVTGEVALGLPLCTGIVPKEILNSMRRKWHVNGIQADMTPYISHPDNPKSFFRDESHIRYEPVLSTASVKTHAYILHCTNIV
jgi:hypothetical protein